MATMVEAIKAAQVAEQRAKRWQSLFDIDASDAADPNLGYAANLRAQAIRDRCTVAEVVTRIETDIEAYITADRACAEAMRGEGKHASALMTDEIEDLRAFVARIRRYAQEA